MKGAAFSSGPCTYLDHLCPLAYMLDIPMIVWEEQNMHACETFYPQVQAQEIAPIEATPTFFSENFDLILHTNQFWNIAVEGPGKNVFCPHGNSDKKYTLSLNDYPISQQYALLYGDHMKDHLVAKGAYRKIQHPIIAGNFRFAFYQQHCAFYQNLLQRYLDPLDPRKKTILYAPTWPDGENVSSFFEEALPLAQSLHTHFNIIIKQHPFLTAKEPAKAYYLKTQYEKLSSVITLDDCPLIYPILDFVDIYIGDFSSIGYDFLAFDKPLYFFNPHNLDPSSRGANLHQCGITIEPQHKQNFPYFLQSTYEHNLTTYRPLREQTYHYAFAPTITASHLRSLLS